MKYLTEKRAMYTPALKSNLTYLYLTGPFHSIGAETCFTNVGTFSINSNRQKTSDLKREEILLWSVSNSSDSYLYGRRRLRRRQNTDCSVGL